MTTYGGMGGVWDGRALDPDDAFEQAVNRVLGARIRASDDDAAAMWFALANADWKHVNGDEAGYSFRAAEDMIAAIRGSGMHMDWYYSGPYATVAPWIEDALKAEGWTWEELA